MWTNPSHLWTSPHSFMLVIWEHPYDIWPRHSAARRPGGAPWRWDSVLCPDIWFYIFPPDLLRLSILLLLEDHCSSRNLEKGIHPWWQKNVLLPTKSRQPEETLDVVLIVKLSKKLWEENHQVQFGDHPSCSVARDKYFACLAWEGPYQHKWQTKCVGDILRFPLPEYFANDVVQIMLHQKTWIGGSISNIKCGFKNE